MGLRSVKTELWLGSRSQFPVLDEELDLDSTAAFFVKRGHGTAFWAVLLSLYGYI